MQNNKIIALNVGIDALSKTSGFPIETAFKIAKINVRLKKALEPFENTRIQLLGKYINPETGQPKDTEAQKALNDEFQKLLEQETDFGEVPLPTLSYSEIFSNSATIMPSKLDTLYRENFISHVEQGDNKLTISGLPLNKLIDLSTALFQLGSNEIPLNNKLTTIILENLSKIVPLAEAAFKGEATDDSVDVFPLDETLLKDGIKDLTPEQLAKLMDFIPGGAN